MQNINVYAGAPRYASVNDLRLAARPRRVDGSKRDNGSVLIIGGSAEYHGAPILSARAVASALAALRIGTGYAVLCVPEAIAPFARRLSPNIIVKEVGGRRIGRGALRKLEKNIGRADAIAIGMGMGREEETLDAVKEIAEYSIDNGKKLVLDADSAYAVKRMKWKLGGNCILTPQDTEFQEMAGISLKNKGMQERIQGARELARRLGTNVLLKGHQTVITNGKETVINRTKSSALATMGTGDILSGMIAGYAAAGSDLFSAGVAGAYLHGRVGDMLNKQKGNHILALDMVDAIPRVIKQFDREIE